MTSSWWGPGPGRTVRYERACGPGCLVGDKSSVDAALRTGRLTLHTRLAALQVLPDERRLVRGVLLADETTGGTRRTRVPVIRATETAERISSPREIIRLITRGRPQRPRRRGQPLAHPVHSLRPVRWPLLDIVSVDSDRHPPAMQRLSGNSQEGPESGRLPEFRNHGIKGDVHRLCVRQAVLGSGISYGDLRGHRGLLRRVSKRVSPRNGRHGCLTSGHAQSCECIFTRSLECDTR